MKVGVKQIRSMQKPPLQQPRRPPKEWNNRFHLNKIPEYNPLEDEHCRLYTESIKRYGKSAVKSKPHAILAPGGLRVLKAQPSIERGSDTSTSRSILHIKTLDGEKRLKSTKSKENISPKKNIIQASKKRPNLVNPETISSLQEEISYLWEIYRIDKVYREAFMESLSTLQPKMYIQILAKEIENLYNEKATVQQIILSIQHREDSIKYIKQILSYLRNNPTLTDIKDQASAALEQLRMASLSVVESAVKFREQLKSIYYISGCDEKMTGAEKVPILYNGSNYLVKMKTDTAFLGKSELTKWFNFSQKIDPFLVTPAAPYILSKGVSKRKQIEALKQQSKMAALPIPPALLKKIKEAEVVIMEEAIMVASMDQSEFSPEKKEDLEEIGKSPSSNKSVSNSEAKRIAMEDFKETPELKTHDQIDPSSSIKKSPVQAKVELEPKDIQTLVIKPLGIRESEVPTFLDHYQPTVPSKLLQSYLSCSELLEKSQAGYEPYWLCLTTPDYTPNTYSSIKGLAVFHMDPTAKLKSRVNILHASVVVESELKDFLDKVVEYIWANVNCEEIRVGLAHIEQTGEKYVPYGPLKTAYQELQFRWKTLTNDEQGKRILVLGINRPASKPFLNPRNVVSNQEPITFKHAVVLSLSHEPAPFTEDKSSSHNKPLPMGQCSYLNAILGLKLAGHIPTMDTLAFTKENAYYSQNLPKTLTQLEDLPGYNLPASKSLCTEDIGQVQELLKGQSLEGAEGVISENAELYSVGIQSLVLKWGNYQHSTYNGYNYIRIKGDFLQAEDDKYITILIQSDDESIGILLALPKTEVRENKMDYWEEIKETITKLKGAGQAKYKEIWIPGFNTESQVPNLQLLDQPVGDKHLVKAADISSCNVYCPRPHDGGLAIDSMDSAFVIDKGFFFGLMHERLDEDLGIPIMFCYVNETKWTKS